MPTPRKTHITVEDKHIELNSFYANNDSSQSYRTFYQRVIKNLKKRGLLTCKSLNDALILCSSDWRTFYGGGKRKEFIYTGEEYPKYKNQTFSSFSAFLKTMGIGLHDDDKHMLSTISTRISQLGWDIDLAIKSRIVDDSIGKIYCISSSKTNKKYIGQTQSSIEVRFMQHKNNYSKKKNKKTNLFQAFKEFGLESFSIEEIEPNIPKKDLKKREDYWIAHYDTIKNGLNMIKSSYASGGRKKETTYEGRTFPSFKNATATFSKETGIPDYIVERAIRKNEPLKEYYRKVSDHPDAKRKADTDATNNLWRRWKGLKKNNRLCEEWAEENGGYDKFKEIVEFPPTELHKIQPKDTNKEISPENFQWMTDKEWQTFQRGIPITIKGIKDNSISEAAKRNGIAISTLFYRLNKGTHPDQILDQPKNSTKKKPIEYEGIQFKSHSKLYEYLAKKYEISIGKAKDRYDRNLPFDKPSHAKSCVVNGEFFESESAAARYYGIKKPTFGKRRQSGWTLEEALGLARRDKS